MTLSTWKRKGPSCLATHFNCDAPKPSPLLIVDESPLMLSELEREYSDAKWCQSWHENDLKWSRATDVGSQSYDDDDDDDDESSSSSSLERLKAVTAASICFFKLCAFL